MHERRNNQARIIAELQRRGIDPTKPVEPSDYDAARLAIRSTTEKIADGSRMVRARVEKRIGLKQVSENQAKSNLETCRSNECGSYGRLANGAEVCHRCNCTGKDLHNKARRKGEECPAGLWGNK